MIKTRIIERVSYGGGFTFYDYQAQTRQWYWPFWGDLDQYGDSLFAANMAIADFLGYEPAQEDFQIVTIHPKNSKQ